MPEWTDSALIIGVKKFAERDAVVSFLTQNHGRHNGLVKGAFSKRHAGDFQVGNLVQISWKARLEEHLGSVRAELLTAYAVQVLDDPMRLTALSCLCAMSSLLPERESVPEFFKKTLEQIALLRFDGWAERYVRWEADLLKALGFGLDLSACAVTGTTQDLVYVSPKSGRAVCREAGKPWQDKLLALPAFFQKASEAADKDELKKAFSLTGFFLENYVTKTLDCSIPSVRGRLIAALIDDRNG
ncbi:MAG: DNA repair protein RecO [Alphaproteobacteria bacterium]|nr:DNA repair protein RecO [Alphaproteobacteria bacterium]MBO4644699.1 DNA repair protein RecO [Alphaproteobacteria bacterium]